MVSYTSKSLNFFYPQNLRKKGEFPYITLTKPKTHNNLTILLLNRDEIFDRRYDERYNPLVIGSSTGSRIEIIRAGEYAEFPGSKEIITRQMAELGAFYTWQLLVPVGQRLVEISIFTDTSNELDELWKPIVDSMKFDIDQINRLRDDEIICRNWTKESTKSKRLKHSFTS
mgnify:CR=1 FL=1